MIEPTVSWGDVFTGLALLLSCFATAMTLLFNNRQKSLIESQKRLNNILLQQGERNAQATIKADLSANLVRLGTGKYRCNIFNKGKAPARDVRIDFPDRNDLLNEREIAEKFPLEILEQQQSVNLTAAVYMDSRRKQPIRLRWSDDADEDNEKTVYLTL